MATNFPNSPSNGATHTFGGTTYTYNSTKGVWKASADAMAVSDTPPSSPEAGALWFDSSVAKSYIYYNDGSSAQWVQLNPSGGTDGTDGKSAYEVYLESTTDTPPLTESEWLESLVGEDGADGNLCSISENPPADKIVGDTWFKTSCPVGLFAWSGTEWIATSIAGPPGKDSPPSVNYRGTIDVTVSAVLDPSPAEVGDFYINTVSGTAHSSFTGIAGNTVLQDDRIIYDGSQWDAIGSASGTDVFVPLDLSTLTLFV